MDEGFASPTDIKWQGNTGVVEYGGGDRGMVAMFYNRAVHHPAKSADAGRPVYEDQIYVRIHPPGERLNIIDRPANRSDQQRWPAQWNQFNTNKQQIPEGTPIDLLYPEQPSIAAMLRAAGVQTVEQCAELSASAIDNVGMGAQRYVNEAVRYLEASNKGVKASQFRHELEERDQEIKLLNRKVEDLMGTIARLEQSSQAAPSLAQVQTLLAGMMARPQHMPGAGFDSQTAMINSTHGAAEPARSGAPKRRRAKLSM